MAKGFLLIVIALVSALFLSSCASASKRQSVALSKSVYATEAALKAGRVDLAKDYNAQAVRLLPAPAKRVVVKPLESQGKRYVTLPVEYSGLPTLSIGSQALTSLISADKPLQRQLQAENKALASVEKEADRATIAVAKTVEKAEAAAIVARSSFWGKVAFWSKGLLMAGAVFALCYLFPPAIPALLGLLRSGLEIVRYLWLALLALFKKGGKDV